MTHAETVRAIIRAESGQATELHGTAADMLRNLILVEQLLSCGHVAAASRELCAVIDTMLDAPVAPDTLADAQRLMAEAKSAMQAALPTHRDPVLLLLIEDLAIITDRLVALTVRHAERMAGI